MLRKATALLLAGVLCLSAAACARKQPQEATVPDTSAAAADLVVIGKIYTADSNHTYAQAFAVKDGKYVYVGDEAGVKSYIQEGTTQVVRNDDGIVLPSATEGHGHYIMKAMNEVLGISHATTVEGIVEDLRKIYEANPNKDSYYSFGWSTKELTPLLKAVDIASMLDTVCKDVPVIMGDESGHIGAANTLALEKAGVLYDRDIEGGTIYRDAEGKANGFIQDQALNYVRRNALTIQFTDEEATTILDNMQHTLLSRGYTNYFDAWMDYHNTDIYGQVADYDAANKLKVNLTGAYIIESYMDVPTELDKAKALKDAYTTPHFTPDSIKLFVDGHAVENAKGWMLKPYPGTGNCGSMIWTQEKLKENIRQANTRGLKIHTHSFGDGANRAMINAVAELTDEGFPILRTTIGHVRNIQPEDIVKASKYNIAVAENLMWHDGFASDIAPAVIALIGEDTYNSGYPIKSFLDNGIKVSSSTDAPAAENGYDASMWGIMEIAVTGQNYLRNSEDEPFNPSELVTVEQAVDCLTINGAWQLEIDDRCGSIEVGKNADFVIGSQDIFTCDTREIHNTQTMAVYFEGELVYQADA